MVMFQLGIVLYSRLGLPEILKTLGRHEPWDYLSEQIAIRISLHIVTFKCLIVGDCSNDFSGLGPFSIPLELFSVPYLLLSGDGV